MHRSLTAVVLCIAAQGVFAQCTEPAVVQATPSFAKLKSPPGATTTSFQETPRRGPELFSSAAAATHEDATSASQASSRPDTESEHPRRGGTAMLLAALALMSGIALRRYGAPGP